MKRTILFITIIATLLALSNCGSSAVVIKERAKTTVLADYIKVADLSVEDARIAMRATGASETVVATIIHDVSLYQIVYHSTYRGDSILLSGLVCVPDTSTAKDSLRHIQYNHATLAPWPNHMGLGSNDAPSLYNGLRDIDDSLKQNFEARLFGLGLAGSGYYVTMPDYAGYGQSKTTEHPYMYMPELVIEAADMVVAGRELAKVLELNLEDGVFLSGWSQGGAVALAQQRYMEAQRSPIAIRATASLAGPYNLSLWVSNALNAGRDATSQQIMCASWMLYSHLDTTIIRATDIWQNPITEQYDAVERVTKKPIDKVFTTQLLKNSRPTLNKLLAVSNNDKGWTPQAPIYLVHGQKDQIVEPSQSEETLAELTKAGARQITLTTYPDGDHHSSLWDYYEFIVETFNK